MRTPSPTLEPGTRRASASVPRAALGLVLGWSPVWVPLALLAQVGLRGLRPALAERARLESEAPLVEERHRTARERFESLELELRAWDDPVFRERWRRAHADGAALASLPQE